MIWSTLVALLVALVATGGSGQTQWDVDADLSTEDDPTMICELVATFEDGRRFSLWLNGNRFFGFSIIHPDWNLPPRIASEVIWRFSESDHAYRIDAVGPNCVIGGWGCNEMDLVLRRLSEDRRMELVFPLGAAWTIDLAGAPNAIAEWKDCVDSLLRAVGARDYATNPFTGAD
jgi:hypothetical protein